MAAAILNGKLLAQQIKAALQLTIADELAEGYAAPGLAVILVGDDAASQIYVRNKHAACAEVGIKSFNFTLSSTATELQLVALITNLNQDPKIHGILLQLPLPAQMNCQRMLELINPNKDVDGFHPYNIGRLLQRNPVLRPCTPYGIIQLLNHIKEPYKNRHAVIIGASNIVGRPLALELLIAGATVTICHRFTENLAHYSAQADILVAAVGKPGLIQGADIKLGATVIDVGINHMPDGSLRGDVEFDAAAERAAWITPVPGGVGPMTVATLLSNTLQAWRSLRGVI